MKSFAFPIVTALLLSACAATVVSSYRAPGTEISPAGIHVVFEDTPLKSSTGNASRENEANQQRLMLRNSVIERLPEKLAESKISSSSKAIPTQVIPSSRDFSSLFPDNQKNWHTLIITPTQVFVACSLSCGYTFRVSMRLIEAGSNKIVWSATIDQPTARVSGGAGRQGAYNNFVDEMTKILLRDIQVASIK